MNTIYVRLFETICICCYSKIWMVDVLVLQYLCKGGKFELFLGCDLSIVFICILRLLNLVVAFGTYLVLVFNMYWKCTLSNLFRA